MNDASSHMQDIALAASIATAMQLDIRIPCGVTVDVSNGTVTLEGEVDLPRQREAAELLVKRLGVPDVRNNITARDRNPA